MSDRDKWIECELNAAAHSFLSANDVEQLFAHMQESGLEPLKWSTQDGAVRLPFSMQEVVDARAGGASTTYFKRQKAPRFEGFIGAEQSFWNPSSIELQDFSAEAVAGVFATAEKWAGEGLFDAVVCGGCSSVFQENTRLYRLTTQSDRTQAEMRLGHHLGDSKVGPLLGLALRTYIGARYVKQFGEDLLLRTPGVVVTRTGDGLMVDLGPEPWTLSKEEAAERWTVAMNHLRPAGIFAVSDEMLRNRTKGPNCQIAYAPRVVPK